jgi:uncharacterized alkaline shock family protein YloU
MADQQTQQKTATTTASTTPSTGKELDSKLVTAKGRTTISDTVVSKIAGISAREVHGVHALGGGTARVMGAIRERIPGARTNHGQGVSVEVGERQSAADIDIIAEYGVSIADLAEDVRRNIISQVERMTGLEVVEVNVNVNDVYVPEAERSEGQQDDSSAEPRVR